MTASDANWSVVAIEAIVDRQQRMPAESNDNRRFLDW